MCLAFQSLSNCNTFLETKIRNGSTFCCNCISWPFYIDADCNLFYFWIMFCNIVVKWKEKKRIEFCRVNPLFVCWSLSLSIYHSTRFCCLISWHGQSYCSFCHLTLDFRSSLSHWIQKTPCSLWMKILALRLALLFSLVSNYYRLSVVPFFYILS